MWKLIPLCQECALDKAMQLQGQLAESEEELARTQVLVRTMEAEAACCSFQTRKLVLVLSNRSPARKRAGRRYGHVLMFFAYKRGQS